MNYKEAKKMIRILEATEENLGETLKKYPRGKMGLTPDSIKALPKYQKDRAAWAYAFSNVQKFNKFIMVNFKKQYLKERKDRLASGKFANASGACNRH